MVINLHESILKGRVHQVVTWLNKAAGARWRPKNLATGFGNHSTNCPVDMPRGIVELKKMSYLTKEGSMTGNDISVIIWRANC